MTKKQENIQDNKQGYAFYKAVEPTYLEECISLLNDKGWPFHIKQSNDREEIVFKMIKGFSLPPAYTAALFAPEAYFEQLDTLFADRKFFFSDNDDIRKVFLENSLAIPDMVSIIQTDDDAFDDRDKYLMREILHDHQVDLEKRVATTQSDLQPSFEERNNPIGQILLIILLAIISVVAIFRFLL